MTSRSFEMRALVVYDDGEQSVTLRHPKTGVQLMKIKLESNAIGTMTRLNDPEILAGHYDCDNFWMGVKPADSVVFEHGLFRPRTQLVVHNIRFENK